MTPMTEDELARSLTAEDRPAVLLTALLELQHFRGRLNKVTLADAAKVLEVLDALRDTSVADTAGPESERDAITRDRVWASGYSAGRAAASRDTAGEAAAREFVESISFVDTAGIDAAWREAEAALPEGWAINMLWGTVTEERWAVAAGPFPSLPGHHQEITSGPTPAAALHALADALRAVPA